MLVSIYKNMLVLLIRKLSNDIHIQAEHKTSKPEKYKCHAFDVHAVYRLIFFIGSHTMHHSPYVVGGSTIQIQYCFLKKATPLSSCATSLTTLL
jgi:hypothetical protein